MNAHFEGKKLDRKVYVGHALVDKTNVDKFIRNDMKQRGATLARDGSLTPSASAPAHVR